MNRIKKKKEKKRMHFGTIKNYSLRFENKSNKDDSVSNEKGN